MFSVKVDHKKECAEWESREKEKYADWESRSKLSFVFFGKVGYKWELEARAQQTDMLVGKVGHTINLC
jgi:hypothetical protein